MSNYLFISDAAKEVKVESHVLRYWEEELHLPIKRNELGHRYYTEEDVERFKQIKSMKERGLQLKAIKMILRDGKLDVLSMEETGIDRAQRRNQAEPGTDVEFADTEVDNSALYQSQVPISEMEMPRSDIDMSERRIPQSRMPQGGMAEGRMPQGGIAEGRMPQGGMAEGRPQGGIAEGRMPQGGMAEGRMPQGGMAEGRMPKVRNAEAMMPQLGMPMGKNAGTRMSKESGGLAIDIISAKEKEPIIQESKEDKSRRLQWLLQQLIRQTLQENNIELCREIRDSVVKELDYQFRMQEEREDARDRMMEEWNEEHYRKMDELIRKKSRRLKKMKPDREQGKGRQDKKDGRNKKEWDTEEHNDENGDVDAWGKSSKGTDENNQKVEEAQGQKKRGWNFGEKSKWNQAEENHDNALQAEQTGSVTKKKRRFF